MPPPLSRLPPRTPLPPVVRRLPFRTNTANSNYSIPPTLQISYSPTKALFRQEHEHITGPNHVRRLKTLEIVQKRDPDILNYKVVTNTSSKVLGAVMRTRLRRRWTAAVEEALCLGGWGKDGRRLAVAHGRDGVSSGASGNGNGNGKRGLAGTMEMVVFNGYGAQMGWEELVRDARRVVDGLIRSGLGDMNPSSNGNGRMSGLSRANGNDRDRGSDNGNGNTRSWNFKSVNRTSNG